MSTFSAKNTWGIGVEATSYFEMANPFSVRKPSTSVPEKVVKSTLSGIAPSGVLELLFKGREPVGFGFDGEDVCA